MNSPLPNAPALQDSTSGAKEQSLTKESVLEFPATLAQRRFWLQHQWSESGNPTLNLTTPLRLRGFLNADLLRRGLDQLIARHEILRTTFQAEHGELLQLISPTLPIILPSIEIENHAAENYPLFIERIAREEAEQPFDTRTGPLLRARLFKLNDLEHLLLLTMHRLISDESSAEIMARELCEYYAALSEDRQPSLPELGIQFADYAHWQHERLLAGDFATQQEYWKTQLTGAVPARLLPDDRSRLAVGRGRSSSLARVLPSHQVDALKMLGSRHGTAPLVVFLALFDVLLHRYTGQCDFFVTVSTPNREREDFDSIVGPLANPLLLRINLNGRPNFLDVLHRLGRVTLDAFANQETPFGLLLDDFQASQLQVAFAYQAASMENPLRIPDGLTIETLMCVSGGLVHDLSAAVIDGKNETRLQIDYDPERFDNETVERMLQDYADLLREVTLGPTQSIAVSPSSTLLTRVRDRSPNSLEKRAAATPRVRPYLGLHLQLIDIWEDILDVRGIGINDDFFGLGGNSLLALRMLLRTERICGKRILPGSFAKSSTIEFLANEMAREAIDDAPSLTAVHTEGDRTPFFYLHGDLFGGGFYTRKLSQSLGLDQPVYVLPPHNLRGLREVPTVEEMAAAHLQALRSERPHGPYIIGGFCQGGIAAYELAQQIVSSGDTVELLLLIDVGPEDRLLVVLRRICSALAKLFHWDSFSQIDHFSKWVLVRTKFTAWRKLSTRRKLQLLLGQVRKKLFSICNLFRSAKKDHATSSARSPQFDVPASFLWASAGYSPKLYSGPVAILLSEDLLDHGGRLARQWQPLAPKVMLHSLKGSHLECITAHVDDLAATIDKCLRDSSRVVSK